MSLAGPVRHGARGEPGTGFGVSPHETPCWTCRFAPELLGAVPADAREHGRGSNPRRGALLRLHVAMEHRGDGPSEAETCELVGGQYIFSGEEPWH